MGRFTASISTSLLASPIASLITLNLGVGCAPSCWPVFGFLSLHDALPIWAARADRPAARRLLRRCVGAKKIVRLHRFFLHQISLESKLNGRQKVKDGNGSIHCLNLYVAPCLAHCLAHHPEPRSGLCPELLAGVRLPFPTRRSSDLGSSGGSASSPEVAQALRRC